MADLNQALVSKIGGLARTLADLTDAAVAQPTEVIANSMCTEIEGLGAQISQLIQQLVEDGGNDQLERQASLDSEIPAPLLRRLFSSTKRIIKEIVPKDTIRIIIQETLSLLGCDRVSLFVHDKHINMLVLNASNLQQPIRVHPGQGISGEVFSNSKMSNIPDCYADDSFDRSFDEQTGYTTRNLLTMPIVDFEEECMGVLQAINKLDAPAFSRVDEIVLERLTQHVGIALRNAEIYKAAITTSERANALLNMIQSLSQDLGVQSAIFTVAMHATQLVQADRCSVFLVDEPKQQLWSVATDSGEEIRIPKSGGIAGQCACEGKIVAVDDAYLDDRFNRDIDVETGYRTKSILAVPVKSQRSGNKDAILAVIQMINKTEFDGEVGRFDDEDKEVMETFTKFVASYIEGGSLLGGTQEKPSGEVSTVCEMCPGSTSCPVSTSAGPMVETITEEE